MYDGHSTVRTILSPLYSWYRMSGSIRSRLVPDEEKTTLIHLEVLNLINLTPDMTGSYLCEVISLTGRDSARYLQRYKNRLVSLIPM